MDCSVGPISCTNGGGNKWNEEGETKISRILISYNSLGICSLEFAYVVGTSVLQPIRHGPSVSIAKDVISFDVVKLNYPSERITWVKGTRNAVCISSLTFGTNLATYGPFGIEDGFPFKINVGDDFNGFFGCSGDMLTAIGVHIKAKKI